MVRLHQFLDGGDILRIVCYLLAVPEYRLRVLADKDSVIRKFARIFRDILLNSGEVVPQACYKACISGDFLVGCCCQVGYEGY